MRISVRLLISSLLAAVVIFGCSILAFASEETPEQVPEGFLVVDQDQSSLLSLSSDIKAATVTEYTTTDIYNFLYSAMRGSSTSSTYSLPYIANRINLINTKVGSIDTNLVTSNSLLSGLCNGLYGSTGSTPAYNVMDSLYHYNDLDGNTYGVAELLAMSWGHLDDISDNLTSYLPIFQTALSGIDSSIDSVNSSVSSGFAQLHSDFSSFTWISGGSFTGVTYDFSTYLDLSSDFRYTSQPYFVFQPSGSNYYNSPVIYHFRIPYDKSSTSGQIPALTFKFGYLLNNFNEFSNIDYFVLNGRRSVDIYAIMPRSYGGSSYPIVLMPSYDSPLYYHYSNASVSFEYLLSTSKDYWSMYDSIKFSSLSDQIDKLTNALAPDKIVEAEAASEQVIDQALDDFTGNGAGAAKVSDSAAMSSVSGSVQSGLDTGASVSNATSVFNFGSDFWGWFSQSNSDYINNPYPAPSYVQTRGSGDEVVDFLSNNENELRDLLGGD